MEMRPMCEKSTRMLMTHYHRLMMETTDLASRDLYITLLRKCEDDLRFFMAIDQNEVIEYQNRAV